MTGYNRASIIANVPDVASKPLTSALLCPASVLQISQHAAAGSAAASVESLIPVKQTRFSHCKRVNLKPDTHTDTQCFYEQTVTQQ